MNLITPLLCLAATIFFEAGGEPEQGKVQVAHVVMNRAADDSRVCEEVKKPGQFSWVPLFKRGKLKIDRTSEMWEDSLQLAKEVLNGEYDSSNKGFTYFHSSRINPGWRTKEKPTKIGGQVFYRIKYDNGYSSSARHRTPVSQTQAEQISYDILQDQYPQLSTPIFQDDLNKRDQIKF